MANACYMCWPKTLPVPASVTWWTTGLGCDHTARPLLVDDSEGLNHIRLKDREPVYLCGDEDGGATLWCWTCGSDAYPVAYYSGFCNHNPYASDGVPSVDNMQELATMAAQHVATHEPDDD